MAMPSKTKVAHSIDLLSAVGKMRENEFICDFTINADNKVFPVHRTILAACSDYFHAMFSHDVKEVREGMVEMKDVDAGAVKHCIDFMYNGEIEITMDGVQSLLHAANIMQLSTLVALCFDHLEANISVPNCLFVKNIAEMYDRGDLLDVAENFVISNFKNIVSTDDFVGLSKPDVSRYIQASNNFTVQVNAARTWVLHDPKSREKYFTEIFKMMNIKKWPFGFILETVWDEPLVQKFGVCKDLVLSTIPTDCKVLEESLSIYNVFLLNRLVKEFFKSPTSGIKNAVDDFMAKNFEQIAQRPEYETLDLVDVASLLNSPQLQCSTEEKKWEAVLKWVKCTRHRKKNFPPLFKSIKLEKISTDFIQKSIRNEQLVKEFHECKDLVMDALFERISSEKSLKPPDKADASMAVDQNPKSENAQSSSSLPAQSDTLPLATANQHPMVGNATKASPRGRATGNSGKQALQNVASATVRGRPGAGSRSSPRGQLGAESVKQLEGSGAAAVTEATSSNMAVKARTGARAPRSNHVAQLSERLKGQSSNAQLTSSQLNEPSMPWCRSNAVGRSNAEVNRIEREMLILAEMYGGPHGPHRGRHCHWSGRGVHHSRHGLLQGLEFGAVTTAAASRAAAEREMLILAEMYGPHGPHRGRHCHGEGPRPHHFRGPPLHRFFSPHHHQRGPRPHLGGHHSRHGCHPPFWDVDDFTM